MRRLEGEKKLLLLHHGKGGRLGAASGKRPHQKVNVPFFPQFTQAGSPISPVETGFRFVALASLKLRDPPASASQSCNV